MATIDEELNVAKQARKALNAPTTIDDVIEVLSKARDLAKAPGASFLSEEALNNSRHEVVFALNDLIHSLQKGISGPNKIGKAKRAAEDWVKELKALHVR
jgi:hypothetical protein